MNKAHGNDIVWESGKKVLYFRVVKAIWRISSRMVQPLRGPYPRSRVRDRHV